MKKIFLPVVILSLTLAGIAGPTNWHIFGSWPAPAANAKGVAYSSPYLYSVLCDGTPPRIYNLANPSQYINLQVPSGAFGLARGMAVTNYTNSYIYVVDTAGSVLSSFRCPKDNPADIETWDPGSYVTVAIPTENLGIRLTSAGSIINSFNGPGTRLTGFAAGGGQGIIFGDPETHKVYCYGYGNINVNEPIGIDASWLTGEPPYNDILVLDAATNYIYLYGWSPYTTVTPASLSRIKALFQ